MDTEPPGEKLQAIHFTRNVNDSFSMFRDNVQRGLLESQSNIRSALEAAIRFGEGKTFKSSTTTTGEYRGILHPLEDVVEDIAEDLELREEADLVHALSIHAKFVTLLIIGQTTALMVERSFQLIVI
jgi:hypothetical protein